MPGCGERCFSRYVLKLADERPSLFGRLVGVLIYGLFLGLVTMAHKGFLLYCYYRFLELHGEDPVPTAYLDGIPSYVTPAYVLLLIVILPFILCACCGVGCKVRNLVHWTLALTIGSSISSVLGYTAQLILYIVRIVSLYQNKKVFLVAVCFCASRGLHYEITTQPIPGTTQDMTTSRTTSARWTSINDVTWDSRTYVTDGATGSIDSFTDPFENLTSVDVSNNNINMFNTKRDMDIFWCQCKVPFENFPIGVTADDPTNDIDDQYLRHFGVDVYVGDVDVHIVNTSMEVKEAIDAEMKHFKIFLSVMEGVIVVLALRLPFWLLLNNIWSHLILMEKKVRWGVEQIRQSKRIGHTRHSAFGHRMAYFVGRSGTYLHSRKSPSRQSSSDDEVPWQTPANSEGTNNQTYEAGLRAGIHKGRQLPEPPRTLMLAMPMLFYCVLETLDAFSLLDEIFIRPHYFLENSSFTVVVMVLFGLNLITTMIVNALLVVPFVQRGKGCYITEFIFIVVTNIAFLVVRVWLFVWYNAFTDTHVTSSFLLFIIKEFLVFLYCTINFGLSMNGLEKKGRRRKTANALTRWRNYTEGIQSDRTDSVWVSMGGPVGETTDTATYTDDTASHGSDSGRLPVYSARNLKLGHRSYHENDDYQTAESSVPAKRDFRYFYNDRNIQGDSYGTVDVTKTDLESLQDSDGGFNGPENMGGFGTFTRRESKHRPKNIFDQDLYSTKPPSSPKYTQQELENMIFYI